MINIWVVLIAGGKDEFAPGTCDTFDTDSTPSIDLAERAEKKDFPLFLGFATHSREAIEALGSDFFSKDYD